MRWSQKVEQTSGWGVANLFIASQSPDYHTCLTTPRLKSQVGMILFLDPVYSNLSASAMAFWPGALITLCVSLTPGERHLCVFVWRHERQIKKICTLFQLYKQAFQTLPTSSLVNSVVEAAGWWHTGTKKSCGVPSVRLTRLSL